jgi:hypothetical protein
MKYLNDFFIFDLMESANDIKFIKQPNKKDAKTDVYNVSKDGIIVGQIKWLSRLHGYGFSPTKDCEKSVKQFLKDLMAERRKKKKDIK